jgi:hypothetical protein
VEGSGSGLIEVEFCHLPPGTEEHHKAVGHDINIVVFRDVTSCSVVEVYRCFGGTYCPHQFFHPEDGGSIYSSKCE